jgi:hypothetical protein
VEYINPVLLMIVVSEICLAICAWCSPRFLRRVAAHLLTRADVMDICRVEKERRLMLWLREIGMDTNPLSIKPRVHMRHLPGDQVRVPRGAEAEFPQPAR